MWSTVLTFDQFIETRMHHLFEGLVKTAIELMILYLRYHRKFTKFARFLNEILNDAPSLHVGHCDVDTFSTKDNFKTGGWMKITLDFLE